MYIYSNVLYIDRVEDNDLCGQSLAQEPLPKGSGNNFLSPYPKDATYQIWYKLAQ